MTAPMDRPVPLATVAREWTRLGCLGFGGPPAHIALLRRLCVDDRAWLSSRDFEDAIAVTNMLPGPASTQLAIWCAWRLRGRVGAVVGGVCFIAPGLIVILALSMLFLAGSPPRWVLGAAAGAGAAVPAVALNAAAALAPASWQRAGPARAGHLRWLAYAAAGGTIAATAGPYLVIVLAVCGLFEVSARARPHPRRTHPAITTVPSALSATAAGGGLGALGWVAFKVGALSYGGGFVIIPLMQRDAVDVYHWMTDAQFLNAVALGQITPGPVVQTVAVVGYAAAGLGGGLLAAAVAFTPSFVFVLAGASHFARSEPTRTWRRSSSAPEPLPSVPSLAPHCRSVSASAKVGSSLCWRSPPHGCSSSAEGSSARSSARGRSGSSPPWWAGRSAGDTERTSSWWLSVGVV